MEVTQIDPDDAERLAEFAAVLEASDKELFPDIDGFQLSDLRAFAQFRGKSRRWELLAASEGGRAAPILGVALMEFPLLENPHSTEITLAVHPDHRRRGVGSAIVRKMEERASAGGRRTLNSIVDLPLSGVGEAGMREFARRHGFESTLTGNLRRLSLPMDKIRLDDLRAVVAEAPDAADYRTHTFEQACPTEYLDDVCNLLRVMSTDEPAGDGERQAEQWDEERIRENDELLVARESRKVTAVAEHVPSGQLVAMTELLFADDAPTQAWQMITVVHPDHRGHRLGLAVKLANVELLAERAPSVRVVQTGNAAVNGPMIAVNEMMGFEVVSNGAFWQKLLGTPDE